jgi:glucose/arabinose dehydrogenase
MQPATDTLWCVVNERDHLGPDVTPDYMTRIQEGGFHGWPWYYAGDKEDPAVKAPGPQRSGVGPGRADSGALLSIEPGILRS